MCVVLQCRFEDAVEAGEGPPEADGAGRQQGALKRREIAEYLAAQRNIRL
jgi:hypothetical protein